MRKYRVQAFIEGYALFEVEALDKWDALDLTRNASLRVMSIDEVPGKVVQYHTEFSLDNRIVEEVKG